MADQRRRRRFSLRSGDGNDRRLAQPVGELDLTDHGHVERVDPPHDRRGRRHARREHGAGQGRDDRFDLVGRDETRAESLRRGDCRGDLFAGGRRSHRAARRSRAALPGSPDPLRPRPITSTPDCGPNENISLIERSPSRAASRAAMQSRSAASPWSPAILPTRSDGAAGSCARCAYRPSL